MRIMKAAIIAIVLALATIFFISSNFSRRGTLVICADIGQGDGAVVISPTNRVAVIDTGGLANIDTGARIMVPILRYMGRNKVDYLFVSHADFDHIGGGEGLVRNINTETIVLPNEQFRDDGLENINRMLLKSPKSNVEFAKAGKVYDLGGTSIRVVADGERGIGNDASTLLEVVDQASGRNMLFTGDISTKREEELPLLPQCDVLKVAHHGSGTSTSSEFLRQVKPLLAVISVGCQNRYGHPSKVTIERLELAGALIARTDRDGCIVISMQKAGIRWKKWRS